jgi:hypothetical protein
MPLPDLFLPISADLFYLQMVQLIHQMQQHVVATSVFADTPLDVARI